MQPDLLGGSVGRCSYESNLIAAADASCMYSIGDTRVLCSLYGPMDCKFRHTRTSALKFDITIRTPSGVPSAAEQHIENIATDVCQRLISVDNYPHLQLGVSIEIISDDGSLLSAILNSFVIAAIDLGMLHRSIALSVSCCLSFTGIDSFPTSQAESASLCTMTQLVCLSTGMVLYCSQTKSCSLANLGQLSTFCQDAAKALESHLLVKHADMTGNTSDSW